jgi:hypothetical protein
MQDSMRSLSDGVGIELLTFDLCLSPPHYPMRERLFNDRLYFSRAMRPAGDRLQMSLSRLAATRSQFFGKAF